MVTSTKVCPLCRNSPARTEEDIIPRWARKLALQLYGPSQALWPARIRMPMCESCNRALNEKFEMPTRLLLDPMIRGQAVQLAPREQALIAAWIVKSDLLMHFWQPHMNPPQHNEEVIRACVLDMLTHGLPPVQSSVRLGRVETIGVPDPRLSPVEHLFPGTVPVTLMHGITTFGPLLWESVVGTQEEVLPFIARTQDNDWLLRIWPPKIGDVPWPTGTLTGGEIAGLRRKWTAVGRKSVYKRALAFHPLPTDGT